MDRDINICYCIGVNSGNIIDKIDAGCTTFSEVRRETGLGGGCGRCVDHGREIFEQIMKERNEK